MMFDKVLSIKTVLVTGGDGMLGNHVVRELLKQNYEVQVFVLDSFSGNNSLGKLNVQIVKGNLLNKISVINATKNCDAVIHIAASTSVWPTQNNPCFKVNVEGTRNVLDAAVVNKVKKVVYVGTANSFGAGTKKSPGSEIKPYASAKYHLDYMDSKYQAQKLVLSYNDKLNCTIVNPTFMFGAHDSALGSGAMIKAIFKNKVPGAAPGGRNYICAKDVAVAIVNAITMGKPGECYILGNKNLSYKEAFSEIAETLHIKKTYKIIPRIFVLIFGFFAGLFGKIFKYKPVVSYPLARISCDEHYYSSQKAIDDLKLPQTPIKEGITEAADWLKENGHLA